MPDWIRYVRQNLNLTHASPADEADAVEDIARQLEDAYLEGLDSGLSSDEAEAQARLHITDWSELSRQFPGNRARSTAVRALQKEQSRRMGVVDWLESLTRDISYAARRLRRASGTTLVAVFTLGLGVAGNTVIFSAINSLLLNPAGITDVNRVLVFGVNYQKLNRSNGSVNTAEFMDVRDDKEAFKAAALGTFGNYNYTVAGFPERLVAQRVTWQWFEVFGVRPVLGRLFTAEEDQPNANRVVILEHGAWQQLFGGDPSVIDRSIQLNQQAYKIIGVMGPEFRRRDVSFWTPLGLPPAAYSPQTRFNGSYELIARIKDGVSLDQAHAQVRVLTDRVLQEQGFAGEYARNNGWSLTARPYTEVLAGDLKTPLFVLMGAVGFVLLIACANIAGLLMARAAGQTRELAVRTALGAGRWSLIRQTLVESLLIAAGGLVLGVFMADGGIRLLLAYAPQDLAGVSIQLDRSVFGFTALIGIAAALLFGMIPALQIAGGRRLESLKEGGRSGTASRRHLRFRSTLVTLEIAVALILLVGAGLFLRSFSNLLQVDAGFDPRSVMTGIVALPPARYREQERQAAFHRTLLERLASVPGITHAATGVTVPFVDDSGGAFVIEGVAAQGDRPSSAGRVHAVSPDYFAAMGIPLLRGRAFTDQDTATSEPVAMIDENLAKQYFPNEDPIGKRIRRTLLNAPWTTIVGIVGHVKHSDLAADSGMGSHYYPVYQTPQVTTFTVIARTTLETASLSNAIRDAVRATDPAQSVFELRTMEERVLSSLGTRRLAVQLMALFASVGVFMAAIGLYGVVSYVVAQRTHEIGIRMALGAHRNQILALVVRHGMRMTFAGVTLGSIGAFILARSLSSQLFEVRPFDPATFVLMATTVLMITLLACIIPARRATAVDPLEACRHD